MPDMSLFACGLSLCAIAGALDGGKDFTGAMKDYAKSLPK